MNIIEVKKLNFSYSEGTAALQQINMSFTKGKIIGVLGGNGAGKSTLFLNLNGILKPDSGQVLFEGQEIHYSKKEIAELRKKIGIVFQDPDDQLFSSSVRKDISFGLLNQGVIPSDAAKRVDSIINELGLKEVADKPTHALSFGQKKRVAIAGVLVMQPSVIIMDEPTAGLDPSGVSEILELLQQINEELGITVILSTHDIDLIPLYCHEVFVLDKGEVVYEGTTEHLFSNPSILREHSLRLPRIAHLMGILYDRDNLPVDKSAATISKARKSIRELVVKQMNEYLIKNGKKLKTGYTTGSCAAAAAKAGAIMLLGNDEIDRVRLTLPSGEVLTLEIEDVKRNWEEVSCAVRKDAGDDPDVTHGLKIVATVRRSKEKTRIDGGIGVGRITKEGLPCRPGEAAINPVPKKMIEASLNEVAVQYGYQGGFEVIISVPRGEEVAAHTFNARLGIIGGISILGTTGIVEPMSETAMIDTMKLEINMKKNRDILFVAPGNYGLEFAKDRFGLDLEPAVKCSNYIGEMLDYAVYCGFQKLLLIGHIGKLVKLAAGVMNTHSRTADCRNEIFAAHAALFGAKADTVKEIMEAATTDEIHGILEKKQLCSNVYESIFGKILFHLGYRTKHKIKTELVVFSNEHGILMKTQQAQALINEIKELEH